MRYLVQLAPMNEGHLAAAICVVADGYRVNPDDDGFTLELYTIVTPETDDDEAVTDPVAFFTAGAWLWIAEEARELPLVPHAQKAAS